MAQNMSVKACGLFVTYSLQVGAREAQLEEDQTSPAHCVIVSMCIVLEDGRF